MVDKQKLLRVFSRAQRSSKISQSARQHPLIEGDHPKYHQVYVMSLSLGLEAEELIITLPYRVTGVSGSIVQKGKSLGSDLNTV